MGATSHSRDDGPVEFGKGYRLLIVDDEPVVRQVLGLMLRVTGFEIDEAEDLAEARRKIAAGSYDIIVTDKNLPDGSGLDLANDIAGTEADCEILLITGYGSYESALEAVRLGFADYLSKPFENLQEVRTRVGRVLDRLLSKRTARAAAARAASIPPTESRRRLRFFVDLRIRFILVDGSMTGPAFVSHLSTTDLFVESDRPLAPGTRVRMRLYLPEKAVDLRGVVRRHGEGMRMMGMRIDFVEPSDEAMAAIALHLAPRRKVFESVDATAARSILDEATEPAAPVRPTDRAPRAAETPDRGGENGIADDDPARLDPDVEALVKRWLVPDGPGSDEARSYGGETGLASAMDETAAAPEEPAAFAPDAAELFRSMLGQQGKVIQFLESLATSDASTLLRPGAESSGLAAEGLAKVPAPFETVATALFDLENVDSETLPLVFGSYAEEPPSEPADEEERLRRKYGLDDDVFDVGVLREKYAIDESLFDDEPGPEPKRSADEAKPRTGDPADGGTASAGSAPTPAAAGAFRSLPPPPTVGERVASRVGQTAEQRRSCAEELRRRGDAAFERGLFMKAASELGLALAFAPEDKDLRRRYEEARVKADVVRADDLYRQGLQQVALADPDAGSKLLLGACQLAYDRRYVLATAKVLLQLRTPSALKELKTVLRAAQEREADVPEYHLLLGKLADVEGLRKIAIREVQRALELDPANEQAKELLAQFEES